MTAILVRHPYLSAVLMSAAIGLAITAVALSLKSGPVEPAREIVLISKDVSFFTEDQPGVANPPLRLEQARPVKLTIRNDEPGEIFHCFMVPGLGVKTSRHLAEGESETLVFTPASKGTFTYTCMLHPMMTGRITVE